MIKGEWRQQGELFRQTMFLANNVAAKIEALCITEDAPGLSAQEAHSFKNTGMLRSKYTQGCGNETLGGCAHLSEKIACSSPASLSFAILCSWYLANDPVKIGYAAIIT